MSKILLCIGMMVLLAGCASATPAPAVEPSPLVTTTAVADAASPAVVVTDSCHAQSEAYIVAVEAVLVDFSNVFTPPAELNQYPSAEAVSAMVPQYEAIRDRAAALDVPDCAHYIHEYLLRYLDGSIAVLEDDLDDVPAIVLKYRKDELKFYYLQFDLGFGALKVGLDLATVPTLTPQPLVVGEDERVTSLPTTLVVTPSGDATNIEVRDTAGGVRRDCRVAGGTVVNAVEASWDSAYIRIEGTDCDGWVLAERLNLDLTAS